MAKHRFGWVVGFWLAGAMVSKALALGLPQAAAPGLPIMPVVAVGDKGRQDPADFAKSRGLDLRALKRATAASGLVTCGAAQGAGQLTLANDVITTAAHVFFDERGRLRAGSDHCQFLVVVGQEIVMTMIDVRSIQAGAHDPYGQSPARDWAVARLLRPVDGITPYGVGKAAQGAPVRFASRGSVDWRQRSDLAMQQCALRQTLDAAPDGAREVAFDCDAGKGASGGALLDARGKGLVAVFVGFRSATPNIPQPFSAEHYNFAVTVEGAFRRAILTAAGVDEAEVGSIGP